MIRVHGICTGQLKIKNNHYRGIGGDNRWLRLGFWALDRTFHAPIPVYVWVVEHPEGLIVVDTGETAAAKSPEFFGDQERFFFRDNFRFLLEAEDEIAPQMRQRGFNPEDVRRVILTHMHMDHSDGLSAFPYAEFLVSRREWELVQKMGAFHGCVPGQFPSFFKPLLVDYAADAVGTFTHSHPVTSDGRVRIVPTPGHTEGHQSVIVEADDGLYFLAGDTSFTQAGLFSNHIDGVSHDARAVRETRQRIRTLAQQQPLIYLPTHDPESGDRLPGRQAIS